MEPQEIFGEHVAKARESKGWTQEDLSHKTGLHFTEISKLERGRRSPTLKTMVRLAVALEVDLSELVDRIP